MRELQIWPKFPYLGHHVLFLLSSRPQGCCIFSTGDIYFAHRETSRLHVKFWATLSKQMQTLNKFGVRSLCFLFCHRPSSELIFSPLWFIQLTHRDLCVIYRLAAVKLESENGELERARSRGRWASLTDSFPSRVTQVRLLFGPACSLRRPENEQTRLESGWKSWLGAAFSPLKAPPNSISSEYSTFSCFLPTYQLVDITRRAMGLSAKLERGQGAHDAERALLTKALEKWPKQIKTEKEGSVDVVSKMWLMVLQWEVCLPSCTRAHHNRRQCELRFRT